MNQIRISPLLLVFLILACPVYSNAQLNHVKNDSIILHFTNEPLSKILAHLESISAYRFAYNTDLIVQQKNITLNVSGNSIPEILAKLFEGTPLTFRIYGNQIIIQKKEIEKITISGYTRSAPAGELLIGATVYLPDLKKGIATNIYGFYSLTIEKQDSVKIEISYAGYQTLTKRIETRKNIFLNLTLELKHDTSTTVTIFKDEKSLNINRIHGIQFDLSGSGMALSPSFSSNGDVLNTVQMTAGVQSTLDGIPGYMVRGGLADQNQILLDEATLYNPTHQFNLISVLNSQAVKKAIFYKSGYPANYGDYLSSFLDIYMKEGNNQKINGDVELGDIVSSLSLNGPLKKGKTTFLLSGRRSMLDVMLRPFNKTLYFSNYYFYDINAKIQHEINTKNRIFLSYYRGFDNNKYSNPGSYSVNGEEESTGEITYNTAFGNQVLNFRWNHIFSRKLFMNSQAIYSNYFQRHSAEQGDYFAQLYSGIRDISLKSDIYFYPNTTHRLRAGISALSQSLFPATISDKMSTAGFVNINEKSIPQKQSSRIAAYVSDEIRMSENLKINAGIRFPVYQNSGYTSFFAEPRLSFLYLAGLNSSIKVSYSRVHQFIHNVQTYNSSFPADIWIGSSSKVNPQAIHEFSAGYFKNSTDNLLQGSIEVFYRSLEHQSLLKGGTTTAIDTDIEQQLIFGRSWSYGAELSLKKPAGKLTGWISYSLTDSYMKFDSLNNAAAFASNYNRKNKFYLSASYKLNTHFSISVNLILTSGSPSALSLLKDSLSSSQNPNPLFDEENDGSVINTSLKPDNFQLAPYKRLDLGIRYTKTHNHGNRTLVSVWSLAVYNATGHQNTYFAYRSINPLTNQPFITQVSFLPVIPSITYSLRF